MLQSTCHKLPNGLTVVHLNVPRTNAAHLGVAVRAGSSNETSAAEAGLAHFVEHTVFKGTEKRNSWHIINRMESVGGELNAFTTKEDTVIYSAFPKGALTRALDLLVDLVMNSRFPEAEIDRERDVICDEINSYLDSPADAVYDDFEDMLYKGTPLGHNILGTIESVNNITGAMCRRWLGKYYYGRNMVVFYAGPASFDSFMKKARHYLMLLPEWGIAGNSEQEKTAPELSHEPFSVTRHIKSHQSHTVMGCALPRLEMGDRMTIALVNNILGGPGMNSMLNLALRERRGLVYNVESSVSNWNSSTMFTTYFGTDPEDNDKCAALVKGEIEKIADGYINSRRLAAAKKQYRGQLILARENIENRIVGIARATLLQGYTLTLEQTDALLAAITPDSLAAMAARLLPLSSLTLRP